MTQATTRIGSKSSSSTDSMKLGMVESESHWCNSGSCMGRNEPMTTGTSTNSIKVVLQIARTERVLKKGVGQNRRKRMRTQVARLKDSTFKTP